MKKSCLFFVIILLVGINFLSISEASNIERKAFQNSIGNILYVGGSGPGNYSFIQHAIDNATSGDTVFVFDDSSPYYELVTVDKSIQLIGENKDTTIIDAEKKGSAIYIISSSVTIRGFTLQNGGIGPFYGGIRICSDYNLIEGNNVYYCVEKDQGIGIHLEKAEYNTITGNKISYNTYGIKFQKSHNNNIIGNNVTNNDGIGIEIGFNEVFDQSSRNIISGNIIEGALIYGGSDNAFSDNNFIETGIFLKLTKNNVISKNNFINCYANFAYLIENRRNHNNKFTQNYWNKPRTYPKIIWGDIGYIKSWEGYYPLFPWIQIDWKPAKEPYDICG